MSIKRKIILSVSVLMAMIVALVSGIVVLSRDNKNTLTAPIENGSVQKPTTHTYQPGQIALAGTNQNDINFKYEPASNQTEISPSAKAYEYIFGRPASVEEVMAVTLKPLADAEGVDVSFAYSTDGPLTFEEEVTTTVKFEAQTINNKDQDIYVYIIVSPKDENVPVVFNTYVRWNFGNAGTITYNVNGETVTETIVKGQQLPEPETPTAPSGYYFDSWFTDPEFKNIATFPLEIQGHKLYARFANLPSNWLSLNGNEYMVVNGGEQLSGDIVIPTMYNGLPVTSMSSTTLEEADMTKMVFVEQTNITSVDIPHTITSIPVGTFITCIDLTKVSLPESLTEIDYAAFAECRGLTSIDLSGCTSLTSIGNYAFSDCSGLTSIVIPASVTSIGTYAFSDCSKLTNIDLSGCTSLTSIGTYAFSDCSGLTSIVIPASVTSIGDGVFSLCEGLTSITLPNTITSIGKSAFSSCIGLTSITLPSSVTTIGDNAFNVCKGLASIDLSNTGLTTIGNNAFSSCSNLTSITLPNTITSIGKSAFSYCRSLTSIVIPASVTKIGSNVFYECTLLQTVELGDNSTWYVVDTETEWNACNTTNATEVIGLTTSASNANANALK